MTGSSDPVPGPQAAALAELERLKTVWVESLPDIRADVASLLEEARRAPDDPTLIHRLYGHVHDLKGQAPIFGYALLGQVAGRVGTVLRQSMQAGSPLPLAQVEASILALAFVIDKGIEGDGGEIGVRLLKKLDTV
ncbi:MAG: hypothetical protein AAGF19_05830 [Pseudomonadota bacterium]